MTGFSRNAGLRQARQQVDRLLDGRRMPHDGQPKPLAEVADS